MTTKLEAQIAHCDYCHVEYTLRPADDLAIEVLKTRCNKRIPSKDVFTYAMVHLHGWQKTTNVDNESTLVCDKCSWLDIARRVPFKEYETRAHDAMRKFIWSLWDINGRNTTERTSSFAPRYDFRLMDIFAYEPKNSCNRAIHCNDIGEYNIRFRHLYRHGEYTFELLVPFVEDLETLHDRLKGAGFKILTKSEPVIHRPEDHLSKKAIAEFNSHERSKYYNPQLVPIYYQRVTALPVSQ